MARLGSAIGMIGIVFSTAVAMGCAGPMAHMSGGGTGTVRIQNATAHTTVCKVQVGDFGGAKRVEHRIEPGSSGDFDTVYPNAKSTQQPVFIIPCDKAGAIFSRGVQNIEFSQGKQHFIVIYDGSDPPTNIETPPGYVRYAMHNPYDRSELTNLPRWQDDKGVKPDWVFFSLRSKCDHNLDFKYTPGNTESSITPPPPGGYKFWAIKGLPYQEIDARTTEPLTIWLRDRGKGGSKDWMEAFKIEPGHAARLEVAKSCKAIHERTDDERFHGCYKWVAAPSCDIPPGMLISKQPEGCPEGTPSIEGDMSKTCEFDTPKGKCIIRYEGMSSGCDVR